MCPCMSVCVFFLWCAVSQPTWLGYSTVYIYFIIIVWYKQVFLTDSDWTHRLPLTVSIVICLLSKTCWETATQKNYTEHYVGTKQKKKRSSLIWAFVCSQSTVDDVEGLLRRHDEFRKKLLAQEDKMKALNDLADRLIREGHPDAKK